MKKLKKTSSEVPPEYGKKVLCQQIPSDLSLKNSLLDQLLQVLEDNHLLDDEDDKLWSRLCIDELLVNAIRHGNKEDSDKKVKATLFIHKNIWALRVEDEGEGFELSELPNSDPDEYFEREHGRGVMLLDSYLDEIWYYAEGNKVQIKKIRKSKTRKMLDKIFQRITSLFSTK
jgi:serine/threonine-protein kinase RsbW